MPLSLKIGGGLLGRVIKSLNRKYLHFTRINYQVIPATTHIRKLSLSNFNCNSEKGGERCQILKSKDQIVPVTGVTIPEFLWSNLEKWSSAPAFECGATGRKYTHLEIYKLSRNFGVALRQHGLKRSEVVGIMLPNIPEYPIALLGLWLIGLVVTTVNPLFKSEEIASQMSDCEAKVLVTISKFVPHARYIQKLAPCIKSIITVGEPVEGCHSFLEMMNANSDGAQFIKGSEIDTTDEVAGLLYSSGTTGLPKGVMLTISNITTNIRQITSPGFVATKAFEKGNEQERLLAILPFFHSFGFTVVMGCSIYLGAYVRTLPIFDCDVCFKAFREHRPTGVHLVTPLINFIVASPKITKTELESIRTIMGGAAPIGELLISNLFKKAEKELFFQEGYGMTESSPVTHILPESTANKKIGSCGVLVPSTECKMVDPTTGVSLGRNQIGEICVRGPQVMKGYFKNEQATGETIDKDGFLRTGDIGYYDDADCFYIVDRIKELIKVKSLQVSPTELENHLKTLPDVVDCAVIGVPSIVYGELPRAYIVKPMNSTLSAKEVQIFIAERVSYYKQLRGGVEFLDEIPKAPSGKILRRELKDAYMKKHTIRK